MIAPRGIVDAIDNAMNPVMVKELRQTVRSGLVTGGFVLFVLALLLTMGGALLSKGSVTVDFRGGPEIFAYLMIVLTVTATCILPMHAGARLAGERADPHAGLLFATTLSTWRIVWGKTLANVILAVIVYSACAPFITFTYLLRGIDFPTIVLVLVISFMVSITVIQFAIFVGALPIGRFIRILLTLACLWLAWTFVRMFMFGFMFFHSGLFGSGGLHGWSGLWEAWPVLLSMLIFDMLLIGLFYVATVALLIPPAANRTLALRLYLMFAWLAMGVMALLWAIDAGRCEPILFWGAMCWVFLILFMLVAVGERNSWGPRIRRQIPKNKALRVGAFVLYTGSGGGITWVFIMIGLTALVMGVSRKAWRGYPSHNDFLDMMIVLFGLSLFSYAYCITAVLLKPRMFKWLAGKPTGVLVLLLFCTGYVLPMFLGYIFLAPYRGAYRLHSEIGWWNLTNPFMLFERDCRDASLTAAIFWASIVAVLSIPWYVRQIRQFRPWRQVAVEPAAPGEPLGKPPENPDIVDNDGSNAD